jgi:1-acyl-sn-glycerol-3-phosphate acyltransferase
VHSVTLAQRIVIATFKGLTNLLCHIDDAQLAQVPDQGPLIIVTNHVNILEIPIIYTHLQPRPVTGFVSAHRWDNRWLRWLLDVCDAIPLHRGEADILAVRRGLERLKRGQITVISPEGTRSGHGRLQRAHPGVVLMALHSGAPLLPVAYYGSEYYKDNLCRLRRTDFHIAVGDPFYLKTGGAKVTRQIRRQMIDEIMYRVSALLPPAYRGVYSDLNAATQTYLDFQPVPG